jgi:hypothetical protein
VTHTPSPGASRASGELGRSPARARYLWYLLLLAPFIGLLYLPFYAKTKPTLWGFPFFYWYQFLWVIIGAAVTIVVYLAVPENDEPAVPPAAAGRGTDPTATGGRA